MMKPNLTFFFFLLFASLYIGQAQAQHPCGTPTVKSDWLTKFQQNPENFMVPEDDTILYIPMTVHLLGLDNGTGHYKFEDLAASICQLNADFAQANIQYFLESPLHYINNTDYNTHQTVIQGAEMMFANDVPNTLNSYFLDDPAGNCGYNLPYASVAMNKGCSGLSSHTWAHEIGHAFTLPHPFLGWEGKTYMEGDTAPVRVTYDYTYFQDTLILDTLIIDTTFVELLDGSNCSVAADGFCDTPPDYLSYRWLCNSQNNNGFSQTDPSGNDFKTSGELFMSYAYDQCQSKFSDNQITAMRSYILNEKPNWLYNQEPLDTLSSTKADLIAPSQGEWTDPNYTKLTWTDFGPTATYHLVVAKALNMTYVVLDTFVTGNSYVLSGLENRNYYWKVQPFNKYSFCTPNSSQGKFKADDSVVAVEDINKMSWRIQPSILTSGGSMQLIGNQSTMSNSLLTIMDVSGRVILEKILEKGQNKYEISLAEKNMYGMYFLIIRSDSGAKSYQKIMIY